MTEGCDGTAGGWRAPGQEPQVSIEWDLLEVSLALSSSRIVSSRSISPPAALRIVSGGKRFQTRRPSVAAGIETIREGREAVRPAGETIREGRKAVRSAGETIRGGPANTSSTGETIRERTAKSPSTG